MHNYTSILDAARGLLGETTKLLNDIGANFVVVGGWSPLLRNSGPIGHPGTRDVDILFEEGTEAGRLKSVVEHFLRRDYHPSAKHDFQLLRILSVAGIDFVFNVDLLHAGEASAKPEMFVDHVSLPVPLSEYCDSTFSVKSIVMPEAAFLFDGHVSPFALETVTPDGRQIQIQVPLMDEVGVVVTKSESVKGIKRKRDALDIYLAVSQATDYQKLVGQFQRLRTLNGSVYNTLYGVREALDKHGFGERVEELVLTGQLALAGDAPTRNEVNERMRRFLDDIGLAPRATNPDSPSKRGAG